MSDLEGAWRLTTAQWTFDDGSEATGLYGPGPRGRVLFMAEGWMSVVITGEGVATADANAAPFTLAYSGRYRTEQGRFVTDVDVSSMPMWRGTEQARAYTITGDELSIVLGMPAHPAYPGRTGRGTLNWRRE